VDKEWPTSPEELRSAYKAAVARKGEFGAVTAIAAEYGVPHSTARRRLVKAGVRTVREKVRKPDVAELRSVYESLAAEHDPRQLSRKVAEKYGVAPGTAWQWLAADGIRVVAERATPSPVSGNCSCGEPAVARFRGEDPPLCYRCYKRKRSSTPGTREHRAGRHVIAAAKKGKPCADCGGTFPPCVMDFDHVPERGPKLFNLGNADYGVKAVSEEMAKCDIVCANCHRIRTWNRKHGLAQ
jgi:hypothetical protein